MPSRFRPGKKERARRRAQAASALAAPASSSPSPVAAAPAQAPPSATPAPLQLRTGDSGGGARPSESARSAKKVSFAPSYADVVRSSSLSSPPVAGPAHDLPAMATKPPPPTPTAGSGGTVVGAAARPTRGCDARDARETERVAAIARQQIRRCGSSRKAHLTRRMRSALADSTPTPQPGVRVQLVTKHLPSLQHFDGMLGRVVSPDVNLVEELADLGRVSVRLENTKVFDGAMYLGSHDFTIAAEGSLPGTANVA